MQLTYLAVVEEAGDKTFGVWFPDFPGCVAHAERLNDVADQAIEALSFHVAGMREDGLEIPTPSKLDQVVIGDAQIAALAPITIDIPEARDTYTRVNLTLPTALLQQIDSVSNNNRSGWLATAAREKLRSDPLIKKFAERAYKR